jgi:16S rRNA G966 N2-methylase RsmD
MEKTKKELEIGDEWLIVRNDVSQYLERCNDTFDLIFCDPPYDIKFHDDIIQRIQKKNILNEDGLIIMEHGKQTVLNHLEGYIETRNFGNVFFSFFQFS